MDFTKAFDTVSHNILLQKLNDLGIGGDAWLWLKNYLKTTLIMTRSVRIVPKVLY